MTAPITLDDPSAYFARLAAFEATHWWSAGLWRVASAWLDRALAGRRSLRGLDVGCGAGLNLTRLAGRPEVGPVVGLDPSREALAYARGRSMGGLVVGSALALPFETASFDILTCLDVLQHLDPAAIPRAAGEIVRVLSPGGVAVVRVNGGGRDGIGVGGLRRAFAIEGVRIARLTPVNTFGSLVQEVRGRLAPSRTRAHPEGGGLPTSVTTGWAAAAMGWVGRAEAAWAGGLGLRLPFGHSAMMLVERLPTP